MSRETKAEEMFRAMSQPEALRTLIHYHAALAEISTWLADCRDHDADMGHDERDPDEEMVDAMMDRAKQALRVKP